MGVYGWPHCKQGSGLASVSSQKTTRETLKEHTHRTHTLLPLVQTYENVQFPPFCELSKSCQKSQQALTPWEGGQQQNCLLQPTQTMSLSLPAYLSRWDK